MIEHAPRSPDDRLMGRLRLPAYSVSEAALLVQADPRTVGRWYYGYARASGPRSLALLGERRRGTPLSYLQLVEVAMVATFRRMGVSLARLRAAREYLARRFEAEFPFAELRLKTDGAHVLKDLAAGEQSWVNTLLVASADGQIAWADAIEDRIHEFEYDEENLRVAIRWYPRGAEGLIVVDPQIAFGVPITRQGSVPTAVIRERYRSGEGMQDIGDDFTLALEYVRAALEFERVTLSAATS